MNNWTVRRRILISFGLILILMLFMGSVAYVYLEHIRLEAEDIQKDSLPGLHFSNRIMNAWTTNFMLMFEHALQEHKDDIRNIESKFQANDASIESLISKYEATIFDENARIQFDAFKNLRSEYRRT